METAIIAALSPDLIDDTNSVFSERDW